MYNITYEDFLAIREEAMNPSPESTYATLFFIMQQMFPGYLYARRSSFPTEDDLQDCLSETQLRIVQRIKRYYFEREDMEKNPESLQRWMFVVLKNCYYNTLRQSSSGRALLEKIKNKAVVDMGLTYTAEGRLNLDGMGAEPESEPAGSVDAIFAQEDSIGRRQVLNQCFTLLLTGRSDPQIVLAWLSVGALMLCRDMKKKDAIALIDETDPSMGQLFNTLGKLLRDLPWMQLPAEDWENLALQLKERTRNGKSFAQLHYCDFTNQSPREYISKSINKRNEWLAKQLADEIEDFVF